MYNAQDAPASAAYTTPSRSKAKSPDIDSIPRTTSPRPATAIQIKSRRAVDKITASASGPTNSMATATPTGMRSMAAEKKPLSPARLTPKIKTSRHVALFHRHGVGRAKNNSNTEASINRKVATPQAPPMGNSSVATAAPNGSDKVAPTTITTPVRETPAVCLTNYSPFFSYIYQPRSARRWGAGISETFSPTMASPIPREAFATALGSL